MELKTADVAKLLQVSTKTVYRWVYEEKIPFLRVNGQYRFDQRQISDWAAHQGGGVQSSPEEPCTVMELIRRGGIHYRLEGRTMSEAITNGCQLTFGLGGINSAEILEAMLRREEVQCTGLGSGIASPHPRTPVVAGYCHEYISVCMTETPVLADTIDGEPIHTLFFVVCADDARHIRCMAKVSYLCRQEQFVGLLRRRALRSEITAFIEKQLN